MGRDMAEFRFSFIQLFFRILARQTGQIGKIDFVPQKPHFEGKPVEQPFERATPESQGISSNHIREYLISLHDDPEAAIQQAMVIRHGKVICECSFAPYQRGMWHVTYSMCKTFTGIATGLAIHEGLLTLNEGLDEIFPSNIKLLSRFSRKRVTVRDLLQMTSGVDYSEAGALDGSDWCTNFMSAGFKSDPGTKFDYNSMNSFMLSAAIQAKSGQTMFDFLKDRIFDPMGIREIFWEKSPMGYTKGGWGCFIRPEDACKIGQLLLNKGEWNGKQLVPKHWVEEMTRSHVDNGKFGYGYQLWMEERPGGYAMNGLFGQDVICYPDLDMILMVNAGNRELFQEGNLTEIMRRYWGASFVASDGPLAENPAALRKLMSTIAEYSGYDTFGGSGVGSAVLSEAAKQNLAEIPVYHKRRRRRKGWGLWSKKSTVMSPSEMLDVLDAHTYVMEKGRAGIFPLVCQVTHNNYTDGIQKIGFQRVEDTMVILLYEGDDVHHVNVGFERPEISEIVLHGEPYYIGTTGRIATDEYDHVVLLLEIAFLEEACTRKINLYFDGEDVLARFSETPGDAVIADAIRYSGEDPDFLKLPFIRQFVEQGGRDLLDESLQAAIHPRDIGHVMSAADENSREGI